VSFHHLEIIKSYGPYFGRRQASRGVRTSVRNDVRLELVAVRADFEAFEKRAVRQPTGNLPALGISIIQTASHNTGRMAGMKEHAISNAFKPVRAPVTTARILPVPKLLR
jgi:hypothetical protein